MEYEKKYKEALKWVQKLYPSFEGWVKEDAEHYFPELKENEDERIRKAIIAYISHDQHCGVSNADMIAWLEKQGGHKGTDNGETEFHVGDLVVINETTYQITEISNSHVVLSFNGRECKFGLDVLNNAQKFEPQFKVGDWVILNGIVVKILDKQKYGFVGLDIDGKDFFCNYGHTDSMRLWTINDAKDGDVLLEEETGEPFIYNGNRAIYFSGYFLGAHCGICNGEFNQLGNNHHWGKNSYPATKEQRDLLFQKMKNAGYEWNAEKKELKKIEVKSENIEPKPLDANKVIEWLNDQACLGWIEDVEVDKFVDKFKKDFGI